MTEPATPPRRRGPATGGGPWRLVASLSAAALLATLAGCEAQTRPSSPGATEAGVVATVVPSPSGVASPAPAATATPAPTATPIPLVPAPLTGRPVTAAEAAYRSVAVMVDDHLFARPQSGFNAASIVWHAPAEGGIPRYMLVFQEQIPGMVGPIRSARQYHVEWAAETTAMLVHHGGSPEAQATLARRGDGEWVYNADGVRWEPRYVWRVREGGRFAPHDVMTDGEHLRLLADRIGAVDEPLEPAWRFAPEAPYRERAAGGTITITYPYERITYRYDPFGNRYFRHINGSAEPQRDPADGRWVTPKNVVILRMRFTAIPGDRLLRLDARNVGSGEAWIATGGRTIKGTWRKASETAPTLLFGPDGEPVTLTVGQTFLQVIAMSYDFEIDDGGPIAGPSPAPTAPAPSPSPTSGA